MRFELKWRKKVSFKLNFSLWLSKTMTFVDRFENLCVAMGGCNKIIVFLPCYWMEDVSGAFVCIEMFVHCQKCWCWCWIFLGRNWHNIQWNNQQFNLLLRPISIAIDAFCPCHTSQFIKCTRCKICRRLYPLHESAENRIIWNVCVCCATAAAAVTATALLSSFRYPSVCTVPFFLCQLGNQKHSHNRCVNMRFSILRKRKNEWKPFTLLMVCGFCFAFHAVPFQKLFSSRKNVIIITQWPKLRSYTDTQSGSLQWYLCFFAGIYLYFIASRTLVQHTHTNKMGILHWNLFASAATVVVADLILCTFHTFCSA